MIRAAILFFATAVSAGAWVAPADRVPASNWVSYLRGVQERCEAATWFSVYTNGAGEVVTNKSFSFVPPRPYLQSVRISLGTVVTNWSVPFATNVMGPIICYTNPGTTNLICWTNRVQLDTEYRTWSAGLSDWIYPYEQFADAAVWTNGDPNLSAFLGLPEAITVTPSRTVLAMADDDLARVAGNYIDIKAMESVAGSNSNPQALINAYFATSIGTNWFWTDMDGDDVFEWTAWPKYPEYVPMLTASSAWEHAGLRPFEEPPVVTTQNVVRFGWEVGQMDVYSVTNRAVVTNTDALFRFSSTPTARPFRVRLGSAMCVVTQRVVTTNEVVVDAGTNTLVIETRDFNFVGQDWFWVTNPFDPIRGRKRDPLLVATNWLTLTPPGTGEAWQASYPVFSLDVVGLIGGLITNTFDPYRTWTAHVSSADFVWDSTAGVARVDMSALPDMTGPDGRKIWIREVTSIQSSNFPYREVWTNGVPSGSNSLEHSALEIDVSGESFEYWGGEFDSDLISPLVLSSNDWAERAAILSQLQWTVRNGSLTNGVHPIGPTTTWSGWGAATNNYFQFRDTCSKGDGCDSSPHDDCDEMPEEPEISGYTAATNGDFSGDYKFDFDGYFYRERVGYDCGYVDVRTLHFVPAIYWPDDIAISGSRLSAGIAADVDIVGRLAWPDPGRRFPYQALTNVFTFAYFIGACGATATGTSVTVWTEDALGDNAWYASIQASSSKPRGETSWETTVDWANGVRPNNGWVASSTFGGTQTCVKSNNVPPITTTWLKSRTAYWGRPTDRRVRSYNQIYRWQFEHLPR